MRAERQLGMPLEVVDFGHRRTGSPRLDAQLVEGIGTSLVIVADATLTGERPDGAGGVRKTPNPNVVFEAGLARGLLGAQSLILLMNREHGEPGELPADIHGFVPCLYRLADGASQAEVDAAREDLAGRLGKELASAVKASFLNDIEESLRGATFRLLAVLLSDESTIDAKSFRSFTAAELAQRATLTEEQVVDVCTALGELMLIEQHKALGAPTEYAGTRALCLRFDPLEKAWSPQLDAETLARVLLTGAGKQRHLVDLARDLNWPARRINIAVEQLMRWGVVEHSRVVDATSPFVVVSIWDIGGLRAVARGALRNRSRRG